MLKTVPPQYFHRLDSMRGIGAFMVAGYHGLSLTSSNMIAQMLLPLLGFFFDGRIGVCIFFVLSGIVLGISIRREGVVTVQSYRDFCIRRVFRIYPAYFVCTVPYLIMYEILQYRYSQQLFVGSGWLDYYFKSHLNILQVIKNFAFLDQKLNVVTWTLKVEVQAALIFPFFHLFSCWLRWKGRLILLLALVVLSLLPCGVTRMNLYLFYLGYLLPLGIKEIQDNVSNNRVIVVILFFACFALLVISHFFDGSEIERPVGTLFAGVGSGILLGLILAMRSSSIFAFLDLAVIRYLGLISYSFYLINIFCLDLVGRLIGFIYHLMDRTESRYFDNSIVVFMVTTILCLFLASFSYHLIERPCIRIGSNYCGKSRKESV